MPRRALLPALVAALAVAGCSSPAPTPEPTLTTLEGLARNDATLRARFEGPARLAFAGLDFATAPTADGAWVLYVRGVEGATLRLVPERHAPSPRTLLGARTLYPNVAPSTDAAYLSDGAGAELLYLLRDATAPTTFSFRMERGPLLASVHDDGQGGLSLRDAGGVERMFVAAPYAVDAHGTRRPARLRLVGDRLTVSLDAEGLAFPVLLDPYIGTARWRRLAVGPGARIAAGLAEHAGNLLLFGGTGVSVFGDTWKWDGARWTELKPASAPEPREGPALGAIGGKAILFGGVDATLTKVLDDTWSFDGTTWTKLSPSRRPPARAYGALVAAGGKLALLGGKPASGSTWIFDGTDWTENTSTPAPTITVDARTTSFGDDGTVAWYAGGLQTWTFDGTAWTDRTAGASTPGLVAALGRVKGKMVIVSPGGSFEWTGAAWTLRAPTSTAPPSTFATLVSYSVTTYGDAIAFFGGRSVGGALDTLVQFGDKGWNQPANRAGPPGRGFASLATLGDRAVLFGGWGGTVLNDTWEFDGKAWVEKKPAVSPSPRYRAAFAEAGDKAVLFGGTVADVSNETWLWDHTTWKQVTPSTPPAEDRPRLARVGSTTVLLAGTEAFTWSGTAWTSIGKAPARRGAVVTGQDWSGFTSHGGKGLLVVPELGTQWSFADGAFSAVKAPGLDQLGSVSSTRPLLLDGAIDLGRYALVLGHRYDVIGTESWLWDGNTWAQLANEGLPPLNRPVAARLGPDVVLFGGFDGASNPSPDTYLMRVALANGIDCTTDAECETGHCASGVCCNTACAGATESCKLPATRGTCAPVLAVCTGPTELTAADGSKKSCAPYLCAAGACLQKCATSADCAGGFVCDIGLLQCVAPAPAEASGGCAVGGPPSQTWAVALVVAFLGTRRRRPSRGR
ncbi:MAG: hypothetical protein JNL79_24915 [Myxococcales bacterium]|nr:hypothetical protein [Myxococcales bacterium]